MLSLRGGSNHQKKRNITLEYCWYGEFKTVRKWRDENDNHRFEMWFNSKICKILKFGSDRREIFIAFAQSGSANSPHSQPNITKSIPKNYRFTIKIGGSVRYKKNTEIIRCNSKYGEMVSLRIASQIADDSSCNKWFRIDRYQKIFWPGYNWLTKISLSLTIWASC